MSNVSSAKASGEVPKPWTDEIIRAADWVRFAASAGTGHQGDGEQDLAPVLPNIVDRRGRPSAEIPAHVSEMPAHVSEMPAHVSEMPAHVSEMPAHVSDDYRVNVSGRRTSSFAGHVDHPKGDILTVAGEMLETYPASLGGVDRDALRRCIDECVPQV